MFKRTAWTLVVLFVCVFAAFGAVVTPPAALIGWMLLGLGVGALVSAGAPRVPWLRQAKAGRPDVVAILAVAAMFVMACLTVTGMPTVFGGGLTTVLLLAFAVAGLWAGRRAQLRRRHKTVRAGPNPHDVIAAATQPAPAMPVATMTTGDLCVAWRRSYYLLLIATDQTVRGQVVERRQDYLDEIERRDPRGFLRWLDSGARAGSDPARYLRTGS